MKTVRPFFIILILSLSMGACCHSPNQARQNRRMPDGFAYVGYNPGYVYPSLSDFSVTLHDVAYTEVRDPRDATPEPAKSPAGEIPNPNP